MADDGNSKPAVDLIYPKELVSPPQPPEGARLDANIYVTMRDGVRLAVDVYRPEAEGSYPALLSLAPYMQDIQRKPPHWSHAIESGATSFYVPRATFTLLPKAGVAGCPKDNGAGSTKGNGPTATI
ncbi:MAG: CocE/NonD family hydrolase [Rhodospirillales bacterium]|nr:CocE/NonD family hydrolase [Rhodospirillales bacterium]